MDKQKDPPFINQLENEDRAKYRQLRKHLNHITNKRHRNRKLKVLQNMLKEILEYAQRGDRDDWKRCCVCGICQLSVGLAINSHQIQYLLRRTKSSINGSLKQIGYITQVTRGDICQELKDYMPMLRGNKTELRKWSVRVLREAEIPDAVNYETEDNIVIESETGSIKEEAEQQNVEKEQEPKHEKEHEDLTICDNWDSILGINSIDSDLSLISDFLTWPSLSISDANP